MLRVRAGPDKIGNHISFVGTFNFLLFFETGLDGLFQVPRDVAGSECRVSNVYVQYLT